MGSFDDDFVHINSVLTAWSDKERVEYLNKECFDLIQKFLDQLYKFREDPQSDFILVEEEELHSDPRWLEIVKTAKRSKSCFRSL